MMLAGLVVNGPTIGNHVHLQSITSNVLSICLCSEKLFVCDVLILWHVGYLLAKWRAQVSLGIGAHRPAAASYECCELQKSPLSLTEA